LIDFSSIQTDAFHRRQSHTVERHQRHLDVQMSCPHIRMRGLKNPALLDLSSVLTDVCCRRHSNVGADGQYVNFTLVSMSVLAHSATRGR